MNLGRREIWGKSGQAGWSCFEIKYEGIWKHLRGLCAVRVVEVVAETLIQEMGQ